MSSRMFHIIQFAPLAMVNHRRRVGIIFHEKCRYVPNKTIISIHLQNNNETVSVLARNVTTKDYQ